MKAGKNIRKQCWFLSTEAIDTLIDESLNKLVCDLILQNAPEDVLWVLIFESFGAKLMTGFKK